MHSAQASDSLSLVQRCNAQAENAHLARELQRVTGDAVGTMHDSEEARHSAAAVAAAADSSSSGEARERRQSTAAVSDSSSSTATDGAAVDSSASAQQLAAVRKQYEKKLQEHEQQRSRLTADLEVSTFAYTWSLLHVCFATACSTAFTSVLHTVQFV
jgi:hypothetical protein